MMSPFRDHVVIGRKFFVGQARLSFGKGTQGPKALVFVLTSVSGG